MPQTLPEELLKRLELAARAVELSPTDPRTQSGATRVGMAGEVHLRLELRHDGTLAVEAQPPHSLPDGLRIQRDATARLQLHADNPAIARRLWAKAEVRKRLEALFEAVPHAQISEVAILLELSPETKEEPLRTALRATLRATSALAEASHALAQEAEQNRERVRSTAVPGELEGGRRFVKLLPDKKTRKESRDEFREQLIAEAKELLSTDASRRVILAHIQLKVPNPILSRVLLAEALRGHDRGAAQEIITVVLSLGGLALFLFLLDLFHLMKYLGWRSTGLAVGISLSLFALCAWNASGWFLDLPFTERVKDRLRRVFNPDED